MRYLIVSDIHANWEALQAVLDATAGQYDQILCCGDLVGYGADPNAVTDWARKNVHVIVRGNHDRASVGMEDLEWFNPVAKAAALWTQRELRPDNAAFIRNLPKGPCAVAGFQMVHGSPLDEDEYLVGAADAVAAFSYISARVTFFGHTHLQGGFIWNHSRIETVGKTGPQAARQLLDIDPDCLYLVNPGSVGQPRDGDARAAYVIYDPADQFLFYHRQPYDIAAAQGRIRQAGLPEPLAFRLAAGR
ncbi:MAG TPA: metallophosphoesterase family protein [Bryobacteraceae bacterium]|nr:metallophosphoesterase family protein [Bryobacteraceae bacterium]